METLRKALFSDLTSNKLGKGSIVNVLRTVINFGVSNNSCSKGKAIPLQALTGPEGSRRLRLPDFKTSST
jgi:hypothetical protein